MAAGLARTLSQRTEPSVTALNMLFAVPREGGNSSMIFLVQMGVIFAIFYFLLLRPQAKERKRLDDMLTSVKKVSTTGFEPASLRLSAGLSTR